MTLKTKLGKAEYDALDDSLKTYYVAAGDGYKLDADYEDVDGLKAKRDELLGKLTEAQKVAKQFEGLDPDKVRDILAKHSEAEESDLLNKRKYDELIQKKTGEWEKERGTLTERIQKMVAKAAKNDLERALRQAEVRPGVLKGAALELLDEHLQFVEDGDEVVWKTKDGLETVDLDKFIPGLKESKADYFNSTLGAGSGATGSNGKGTGTTTDTSAPPEQRLAEFYAAKT